MWFGWAGRWKLFGAAYAFGWALIALAWLFLLFGSHGTHGTTNYMLAWGLTAIAPMMVLASLVTAALAILLGKLGDRFRDRRANSIGASEGE